MTTPVGSPFDWAWLKLAMALPAGREESHEPAADADDIRRSLDGDGDAYRRLVARHQDRVSAMMWRFSRDPETHEELVQDVFVGAYLGLERFRGEAPFAHWLARIATRTGYRHWKARAKERERTAPEGLEEWSRLGAVAPESLEPTEAAGLLHRLLDALPPRDRLILTLRFVDERTVEEAARLTGWSASMVKVQTWRARGKLKRLWEEAGKGRTR